MSLMSTPYASHRLRNGTAGILLPLRSHRQTVDGSTSANSAACASEYPAFTLAAFNVIFISSHHPIILYVHFRSFRIFLFASAFPSPCSASHQIQSQSIRCSASLLSCRSVKPASCSARIISLRQFSGMSLSLHSHITVAICSIPAPCSFISNSLLYWLFVPQVNQSCSIQRLRSFSLSIRPSLVS